MLKEKVVTIIDLFKVKCGENDEFIKRVEEICRIAIDRLQVEYNLRNSYLDWLDL